MLASRKLIVWSRWNQARCSELVAHGYGSNNQRINAMDNVALKDIEAIARIESAKMQHFYLGVEHLFIALTKLEGGLTAAIFDQGGQSPRYLRYAIRELTGRGDDRRYWPGYRTTPRTTTILKRAQELIDSKIQPDE